MVAVRKLKSVLVRLNPVLSPGKRKSVHLPLYRRWTNGLTGRTDERKKPPLHLFCAIKEADQ
jgi:hypothetical protein